MLGAGRSKKGESIDYGVGVVIHCKVGDRIEIDQPLFTIYANREAELDKVSEFLLNAYQWSDSPVKPLPLFYEVVK